MASDKSKNVVIGVLLCVVVVLTVVLAYSVINKTNSQNNDLGVADNSNDTEEKSYSYKDIKGMYGITVSDKDYDIYLYENGTFSYVISEMTSIIYIGNYIINDNKIELNYWLTLASQVEGNYTMNETGTITINEDGTLSIHEQPGNESNKNLTLSKISGQKEQDLLESKVFDISYLIESYLLNY